MFEREKINDDTFTHDSNSCQIWVLLIIKNLRTALKVEERSLKDRFQTTITFLRTSPYVATTLLLTMARQPTSGKIIQAQDFLPRDDTSLDEDSIESPTMIRLSSRLSDMSVDDTPSLMTKKKKQRERKRFALQCVRKKNGKYCEGTLHPVGTQEEMSDMRNEFEKRKDPKTKKTKKTMVRSKLYDKELRKRFPNQRAKTLEDALYRQALCKKIGISLQHRTRLSCDVCGDPDENKMWPEWCEVCEVTWSAKYAGRHRLCCVKCNASYRDMEKSSGKCKCVTTTS